MEKTSWEESRQRSVGYSRTRPEDTPLDRIVFHYHEELERCWSDVFEWKYGVLRDEAREAFLAYLNCGILFCGTARAYCANCRHSQLIAGVQPQAPGSLSLLRSKARRHLRRLVLRSFSEGGFLARYLKKALLSLERLNIIDSPLGATAQVVKHCDDSDVTRELSPLEFLAELSCHIPDVWEQSSRYFGC